MPDKMTLGVLVLLAAVGQLSAAPASSLQWSPDTGVRVSGPDGVAYPTFVMQRPDGNYAMYFYDGDGWTFGDTGYATSADGMSWTYQGRVLTHEPGGDAFDDVNAVITHIVTLPGGKLRAYAAGMESTHGDAPTSIFYTETTDPNGETWPGTRHQIYGGTDSAGQVICPRVYGSDSAGYTMYYLRGQQVVRTTSSDGVTWPAWDPNHPDDPNHQVVLAGPVGEFDIVERPGGGYRMFVGVNVNIDSYFSSDGVTWAVDANHRLTPDLYAQTSLGRPVVTETGGDGKMYIYVDPERGGIRSATAIPEPATLSLVAFGACLALLRRRR